ncbi:MAG: hypothetical protein ACK504_08585 [Bacteroidota bacterium]
MRLFLVHIVILLFASFNLAGKGLLLNFNQDCSKYKQLFDEATISLSSNLPSAEYNKLKKLRDEINSDPNQFAEFIDNTGNVAAGLGSILTQRVNFWNDWINKCFPAKNWSNTTFKTFGKDYNTFKSTNVTIYNDMKALNSNELKLKEFIESCSNTSPIIKINVQSGDVYYKIVRKGEDIISSASVYYIDQAQLNLIKANPEKLEQVLGLPLSSVSSEYDVFKITYQGSNPGYVFKSTIASTEQYANATQSVKYNTTGGGKQILILNNLNDDVWIKSSSPLEPIIPNQIPLIGN